MRNGIADRQGDKQTDDLITRCPRRTFQAGDIKKVNLITAFELNMHGKYEVFIMFIANGSILTFKRFKCFTDKHITTI